MSTRAAIVRAERTQQWERRLLVMFLGVVAVAVTAALVVGLFTLSGMYDIGRQNNALLNGRLRAQAQEVDQLQRDLLGRDASIALLVAEINRLAAQIRAEGGTPELIPIPSLPAPVNGVQPSPPTTVPAQSPSTTSSTTSTTEPPPLPPRSTTTTTRPLCLPPSLPLVTVPCR